MSRGPDEEENLQENFLYVTYLLSNVKKQMCSPRFEQLVLYFLHKYIFGAGPVIINQKRLRYFHAVHTHGQIRKAADYLNTDSSVITRQIYLLEQEVGAKLFDRRPRGMVPTEVGEFLLDYYRCTQSAQQDFEANLTEFHGMRRGNVTIATFSSYIDTLMDQVINDFHSKDTSCLIEIKEISAASKIINAVIQDEVHIGIVHSPYIEHPEIRCHSYSPQPLQILVNNEHPLAGKKSGTIEDVLPYPIVQPPPCYSIWQATKEVEDLEKIQFTQALTIESFIARKKAAVAGLGAIFLTPFGAQNEIINNQLVLFKVDHPIFNNMGACLIVRRGRALSPLASFLIGLIETKFSVFNQNGNYFGK